MAKLPVFLFLFCYWSLILTVTGFTTDQMKKITDYISVKYNITRQHAYTVKFNENECNTLSDQDIKKALEADKADDVRNKVLCCEIYEGTRLTMASFKELGGHRREHAEHRLLYPAPKANVSPVKKLLNKLPPAGCVVFFTLKSPCQTYCTNPQESFKSYNIVRKLDQFRGIKNKAFVYNKVYNNEPNVNVQSFKDHMKFINHEIPLYRCDGSCLRCFPNGGFNENCFA